MKKKVLIILLVLAALSAGAYGYTTYFNNAPEQPAAPRFRFAKVRRGNLRSTVSATGTVEPVTLVQVGSQVSGTIKEIHADFNQRVTEGMVIAQLDSAPAQAKVDQFRARLAKTQASLQKQDAEIAVIKANLENSEAELLSASATAVKNSVDVTEASREAERYERLYHDGIIAASLRDSKLATRDGARAQQKAANAKRAAAAARVKSLHNQLLVARAEHALQLAQIKETEAELRLNETNLSYTTIRSPITGVVISRDVDVGQTVAASLQAPTLFTIAQDLTTMQVVASVDEADVGMLATGNDASFTVDAFPNARFKGRVREIRNAPKLVQNVVTYDAIITVDNSEGKLRPGMTATATIIVADRADVLMAPTEAMNFVPPILRLGGPRAERLRAAMKRFPERFRDPKVWVFDAARKRPRPVPLQTGFANDTHTEIVTGELQEGSEVILAAAAPPRRGRFGRGGITRMGRRLRRAGRRPQ